MALWNDLIPRLHRPSRPVDNQPTTTSDPSTSLQHSSIRSTSPVAAESTLAAMKRDRGAAATALSAVGQDRKPHDLQHDADVISGDVGGVSGNGISGDDVAVSFTLALTVGCILLALNVVVFVGTMCQWPRLRRRRRNRRKQRHAAALAALTSHPVDNRKSDGGDGAGSSPRADEDTRLTLLCADDRGCGAARAGDSCRSPVDCRCTRPDEGAGVGGTSNFCDRRCSANLSAESLASARSPTNTVAQCNHVYSRSQFTAV